MVPDSRTTLDRLPSLPQVLTKILDAIHSERADFQHIATIIHHDTAMTARLLGVANSSYYGRAKACQTIERALLLLGTETVKTIVITAAIKQFFNRFNPQHTPFVKAFWRRSLISANFAHILANLTSYSAPDEAYLCGLLMDVGQLILLNQQDHNYIEIWSNAVDDNALLKAEREHFQRIHSDIGADMIDAWQLSNFMGDAVRFHHAPGAQILDAHHLVKIINLSSLLSAPGPVSDEAIAQADQLFGLTEALTRELCSRIAEDVERLAGGLNIDIGGLNDSASDEAAQQSLGERLGVISQLGQINSGLWRSQTRAALEQAIRRIVFMTLGIEHCLLFIADPLIETLVTHISTPESETNKTTSPDFTIPLLPNRSVVSDAILQKQALRSSADNIENLAVIDRQLLKYCAADFLLCVPLTHNDLPVGALVLGLDRYGDDPQASKAMLLTGLCSEIAAAVHHHTQQLQNAAYADGTNESIQQKIGEAVHEASNPLSIIRNYLEMLRIKLGEQHHAHGDLELIKQEIDRVGTILLRLREPESTLASNGEISLNKLVTDIARIFQQSLCITHQITLDLNLSESLPQIRSSVTHLQQILTNLLKNAVEALPPGGHIMLSTDSSVIVNGQLFAAIAITDDGPGIPETVMRQLFSPVISNKGAGHSGLGLSITKKLMDEIGGSIVCKSNKKGTQFQLLIPIINS
jgi:HD-like signal output (HDOD) protein/signal transduction histidine kinase